MKYALTTLMLGIALICGCATTSEDAPVAMETTAEDLEGTWVSFERGGTESEGLPAGEVTVIFGPGRDLAVHGDRSDGSEADYEGTFIVMPSVLVANFTKGAEGMEQFPFSLSDGVLTIHDSGMDAWRKFRRQAH